MTATPALRLRRVAQGDARTFGVLVRGGVPLCVTCEDPCRGNARGVSCVPAGTYRCVPHSGPRFKGVWRLEDVPGRDAILLHAGNSPADSTGCVLLGKGFAMAGSQPVITESRATLAMLRATLPATFLLTITDPTP